MRASREAPFFVLALAVVGAGTLLLGFDSRLTFIADDWELLLVRDGWGPEERWEPVADSTRSSLAAIDFAGDAANPEFGVVFPPSIEVSATTYLEAADAHGSPAYDEAELAVRPEAERAGADLTMAQALGLALQPPAFAASELDCQTLGSSAETAEVELAPGEFTLANEGSEAVEVMLGRFGEAASVNLGPVEPGVMTSLAIPADNAQRLWRLALVGAGPVSFCGVS